MGTDIHGFYQRRPKTPRRSEYRVTPRWRSDEYVCNDYHVNVDVLGLGSNTDDWHAFGREVIGDRNYLLFAVLADVRNGRGFAGCEIFDPIKPIKTFNDPGLSLDILFSPRCFTHSPNSADCCYDSHWLGYHDHHVITAEEILNYDWQQTLVDYGVFAVEDFLKFLGGDKNVGYCGDVDGVSVIKHPRVDMTGGKAIVFNTNGYTHIPAKWDAGTVGEHLTAFLNEFHQVLADNPDYDIRLVIGFDS